MGKGRPKKLKWEFAIGTTSRVPNSQNQHYLIMDIDWKIPFTVLVPHLEKLGATAIIIQRTQSGHHVYTDIRCSWDKLFHIMPNCADEKWLQIGKRRGYLFLADKNIITMPWPVERMVIHHG